MPLFPVFGIRLEIHATFALLLALVGWQGWQVDGAFGALWSLLLIGALFICVTLHELGHSLTARRYGIETTRIVLLPIGGMAQMAEIPREPRKEFAITAAGPAVNFVLAAMVFGGLWLSPWWPVDLNGWLFLLNSYSVAGFLTTLAALNLFMGTFNLLPVFPMDGGRVLRAFLATRNPYLQATRLAVRIGRPLAIIGAFAAVLWLGNWLLAALFGFIYFAGTLELRLVERRERWRGLMVGEAISSTFHAVHEDALVGDVWQQALAGRWREVVVLADGRVVTVLSPSQLAELAQNYTGETSLRALSLPRAPVLQASWPVSMLGLEAERSRALPVYQGGRFIGILRPSDLDDAMAWRGFRTR